MKSLGQKGFAHPIFLLLSVVIVAVIGFAGYRVAQKHNNKPSVIATSQKQSASSDKVGPVQATLPICSAGALYSASPIELDKLSSILPLGNFNPLPSDHLYFVITRGDNNSNENIPVETVDLFSPGDVTVFQIGRQIRTMNGVADNTDYYLSFAPCREVSGTFGHVSSLSGPLSGIDFKNCDKPYSIGNSYLYQHCSTEVNIKVQAGEKIGTAGGKASAALDFSNDDTRVPVPYVANPNHNYDLTATCAVDYYKGALKASLQALLGGGQVGSNTAHRCGEPFQDKKGTLQGDWYYGTTQQANGDITRQLALVHENYDPTIGAISVGGTITGQSEWKFTPTHSSSINREFSEITPGTTIYCYQDSRMPGRILIQLVSATNINIEEQTSDCSTNIAFNNPYSYQR
jgi:hypothetical protein